MIFKIVFWVLQSLIKFASGMSSSARSIPSLENFLVRTRRPPSTLTTRRTSTRTRCRRRTKQSQERHSTPKGVSHLHTKKCTHIVWIVPIYTQQKIAQQKMHPSDFRPKKKRPKIKLGFLFKKLFLPYFLQLFGDFLGSIPLTDA